MNRLPLCDHCRFNAHWPDLVCAIHPYGQSGSCADFEADPCLEDDVPWLPRGAAYYDGELILQPENRWTDEQRLDLLNWHPLFTGRCPNCEMPMLFSPSRVHWDCNHCAWKDDSL